MALSHPGLPGGDLASLGQNEVQKGRSFLPCITGQPMKSFGAGPWFYNGDLQSLTSIPDSSETELCGQH